MSLSSLDIPNFIFHKAFVVWETVIRAISKEHQCQVLYPDILLWLTSSKLYGAKRQEDTSDEKSTMRK